jgi:hypothetical protein
MNIANLRSIKINRGKWTVLSISVLMVAALFTAIFGSGLASGGGEKPPEQDSAATQLAAKDAPLGKEQGNKVVPQDVQTKTLRSSHFFDPARPLGEQLSGLRDQAKSGNRYATCLLAAALDSCGSNQDRLDENPLGLQPEKPIETSSPEQIEGISNDLEKYRRQEMMCADITQTDIIERDVWMRQSAMYGHPGSMAEFVRQPKSSSFLSLQDADLIDAYRKSAESMLNRAAEAGVYEAIRGVYLAYSRGAIETTVGELQVERDPAKAVAAARALMAHAVASEKAELEKSIAEMMAAMGQGQRSRIAELEKKYRKLTSVGPQQKDFPEVFCADLVPRS